MGNFLHIFIPSESIRNTLRMSLFAGNITIHPTQNLIGISLNLFITKTKSSFYSKNYCRCCQPRSTSSSEVLQPKFWKKIAIFFSIYLRYPQQKPSVAFHDNLVFLLRKISKKAPNFQPAAVVLSLKTHFYQNHVFENGLHDYSKTNEPIDLKLTILFKNVIFFYMNIKWFQRVKKLFMSFFTDFFVQK